MIQMRKWAASAKLSGFSYIQWLEGQMSSQTRTGFNLIIEELAFLRVVFLQDDIEAWVKKSSKSPPWAWERGISETVRGQAGQLASSDREINKAASVGNICTI